jgi:hypothetical protein
VFRAAIQLPLNGWGVIRYVSYDFALSGLNDISHPRFAGRCRRCPALLLTLFQSFLYLPTTNKSNK